MTTTTTSTTTTTTQPPYSGDADLEARRSNILDLGVATWDAQSAEARDYINRDLESGWYRQAARDEAGKDYREYPFDPNLLLDQAQVQDASVYKTLELAYEVLSKDRADDAFRAQESQYRKRYEAEIKRVIKAGLHYDWDADGALEVEERSVQRRSRRLTRC